MMSMVWFSEVTPSLQSSLINTLEKLNEIEIYR
jgi:hypothetical protein